MGVSNFISNLKAKSIAGKEFFHFSGVFIYVFFRYVCIDIFHRFIVIPAADLLRYVDRHTDVDRE